MWFLFKKNSNQSSASYSSKISSKRETSSSLASSSYDVSSTLVSDEYTFNEEFKWLEKIVDDENSENKTM